MPTEQSKKKKLVRLQVEVDHDFQSEVVNLIKSLGMSSVRDFLLEASSLFIWVVGKIRNGRIVCSVPKNGDGPQREYCSRFLNSNRSNPK